jgi:hypothetical protein
LCAMEAQSVGTGSSLSDGLRSSRGGGDESDASSAPVIIPSTQPITISSQQKQLRTDIKTIDTYLAREEAPKFVRDALERVRKTVEIRDPANSTADALKVLHEAVQKLAGRIDAQTAEAHALGPAGVSYAAAARRGAVGAPAPCQSPAEPTKPVPARHKREIIVARGGETPEQARRTGKEVVDQLNSVSMDGQIVAARNLPSGDIVLTTDEEATRTKWLTDQRWTAVLGKEAQVKRREFVVLAYSIKVVQIQDIRQAIEAIYSQNPKLQNTVEILQVVWAHKLLRASCKTGPLHISVAELEQANILIQGGLIWDYQLHDCEPYIGEC